MATGTYTNSGLTLSLTVSGAPQITTGAGAPASTPTQEGDIYIDTTNDAAYIAVGTASAADWEQAGAGSGLANLVDDLTPQLGGQLDVNGQAIGDGTRELLTFTEDGAAVNHVNIENQATGGGPIISAAGDDTNIDLLLAAKGTGNIKIGTFNFNADQSVGAPTDNYVLTYDHGTGLIGLEASAAGSGDMAAATYDPANISQQLVGLTATQTLTNKTLTQPTITLKQGTTPTAEGDIQWDATNNKIVVGDAATTKTFVPVDSITGDVTITTTGAAAIGTGVIVNTDISASAAIDATKIHDGTVTNAQFGYLSGVTSAIQTQINAKATLAGATPTGVWDFGGATSLELPNGTAPTVDAAGEVAIDSNGVSPITTGVMTFYDGTRQMYVVATTNSPASDNDVPAYDSGTNSVTWQAQSGAGGGISNVVEDTTPQLGGMLDVNGQSLGDGTLELLKFSETVSAVNELTVTNAATGNAPSLSATGDDTNISLNLVSKGSGTVKANSVDVATTSGTQTLTNKTISSASNTITVTESTISDLGTLTAMVADNLSVFASTTSAQLAGVISDETGSGGVLVFNSNPTLTGATLAGNLALGLQGIIQSFTAETGSNFTIGEVGYVNTSNKMVETDASAESTCKGMLGMALGTINAGASGNFLLFGYATGLSGLTAGEQFLSETTGAMTTTKPSTASTVVRKVGYAPTTTTIWFNPSMDYVVN